MVREKKKAVRSNPQTKRQYKQLVIPSQTFSVNSQTQPQSSLITKQLLQHKTEKTHHRRVQINTCPLAGGGLADYPYTTETNHLTGLAGRWAFRKALKTKPPPKPAAKQAFGRRTQDA